MEFTLSLEELSYYGPGGQWVCDPGKFKVWIGGDSSATLEGEFLLANGTPETHPAVGLCWVSVLNGMPMFLLIFSLIYT